MLAGPALGRLRQGGARAPLDAFAGQLYAASGLARLLSAWSGPCLRARRSSDNAEMDVGFAGQWPDMGPGSAFAMWLGASNAYLKTRYDQKGQGHDWTQTANTQQPRLALGGVVDVGPNGHPVAVYDGLDDCMDVQNSVGFARNTPAITLASIAMRSGGSGNQHICQVFTASGLGRTIMYQGAGNLAVTGRRVDADAPTTVFGNPFTTGAWHRAIGRARPGAALADILLNGGAFSGAYPGPGNFADTNSSLNIREGSGNGTNFVTGAVSISLLAQGVLDPAALNAALLELMP